MQKIGTEMLVELPGMLLHWQISQSRKGGAISYASHHTLIRHLVQALHGPCQDCLQFDGIVYVVNPNTTGRFVCKAVPDPECTKRDTAADVQTCVLQLITTHMQSNHLVQVDQFLTIEK